MTEYELINPSDPYTFLADDFETAALVVFALGTGYGARSQDGGEEVPIFIFGGAAEWYAEKFGRDPDAGITAKMTQLSEALGSMMYGSFEDRRRYTAALEAITDTEKREKFIADWQDGISSLNNIGGYAHKLGKLLARKKEDSDNEDQ